MRVTPTNAGPDSKGIVSVFGWDLEGLVAFYLVGGGLAGMLLVLALTTQPMGTRIVCGLLPVIASAIWIKVFVHGRPPAYQRDVFERRLRGTTFRLRPQRWCRMTHPRNVVIRRLQQKEHPHG